jgi:acid phosphatase type 7
MKPILLKITFLVLLSIHFSFAQDNSKPSAEVKGMFLTWAGDPTSTMVIDFHTLENSEIQSKIEWREKGKRKWQSKTGTSFEFPYSDRKIHRIKLSDLKENYTYEFRIPTSSNVYSFRTMPRTSQREIRFVTGGDTMHQKGYMNKTNSAALEYDPDFIVWGGDLAYANGDPKNINRWFQWYESIQETLVDKNGRVVPVISAIGNHEVQKGYHSNHPEYEQTDEWRKKIAPFYYSFFEFPGQPGYNVMDFGNYLSIILLDTDHSNPIDGKQTDWLDETLKARALVPHVFPVYHVPAYPSHRKYDGVSHERVRNYFVPLFEKHGVKIVFENHDHSYKRTHTLLNGEVVEKGKGVTYIGDGCWGTDVRTVREDWYLAKAQSIRHFIVVTIKGKERKFLMVDENGNVIDDY